MQTVPPYTANTAQFIYMRCGYFNVPASSQTLLQEQRNLQGGRWEEGEGEGRVEAIQRGSQRHKSRRRRLDNGPPTLMTIALTKPPKPPRKQLRYIYMYIIHHDFVVIALYLHNVGSEEDKVEPL